MTTEEWKAVYLLRFGNTFACSNDNDPIVKEKYVFWAEAEADLGLSTKYGALRDELRHIALKARGDR